MRAGLDGLTEIIPVILQRRPGVVMVLHAYFDESYRAEHLVRPLCVAGYAFQPEAYRLFAAEWAEHLRRGGPHPVPFFHATELYSNRSNTYGGWSVEDRAKFLGGAAQLIRKHMLFGLAVLLSEEKVMRIAPGYVRKYGGVYTTACQLALQCSGARVHADELVAYVFENGHRLWKEANAVLTATGRDQLLAQRYRYASHTAMAKEQAYGLQAADLLAWVVCRHVGPPPDNHTMRAFKPVIAAFAANEPRTTVLEFMGDAEVRKLIQHQEASTDHIAVDLATPKTPKSGKQRKRRKD